MNEPLLNAFDLRLGWHAGFRTRELLESGKYPKFTALLAPSLLAFIEAVEYSGGRLHGPRLLLTEFDFFHLEWVAGMLCCRHPWVSLPEVTAWWPAGTGEVAAGLGPQLAANWWKTCRSLERKLHGRRLRYPDGIKLLKVWVRKIRQCLQALGRLDLIPAPLGRFPSPRNCGGELIVSAGGASQRGLEGRHLHPSSGRSGTACEQVVGHERDQHQHAAAVPTGGPPDWSVLLRDIGRIAEALAPEPGEVVGSLYVARRLGCTVTWVAQMVRKGNIPRHCIVKGTGNGKPWKFHRAHIDAWIESR